MIPLFPVKMLKGHKLFSPRSSSCHEFVHALIFAHATLTFSFQGSGVGRRGSAKGLLNGLSDILCVEAMSQVNPIGVLALRKLLSLVVS